MNNQELYHYGILGMKWGVRRDRRQSSEKKVSDMTNAELQAVINRINLEKQYKQAMAEMNAKQKNKFAEWSKKLLGEVATDIAKKHLTDLGKKALKFGQENQEKKAETQPQKK